ncbi:MAG TPA: flavodoxin [Methanoregula sp.]|nr:flavodoxin [Methanoregula sp.]
MNISIICYSHSGNTRSVAERVAAACGGRLIEVQPVNPYSRLTAYTLGSYRARKGICDPIEPQTIDVSRDDLIVIGTPVWAGRAAPPVNAAVAALEGCKGKKAVIFATCGKVAGDTLPMLKKALEARGVTVAGEFMFDKDTLDDTGRIGALISAIKTAGGMP